MFVQMKRIVVTEGNADQVIQRFSREGMIEKRFKCHS